MMSIKIKNIIFLLIFIPTISYSQNINHFWNDIGITIQQLFIKMNAPDDVEYQAESNSYWFAYDYGEKAIIYIIDKGLVVNVIFMKSNVDGDNIANEFCDIYRKSLDDGFKADTTSAGFYINKKDNIIQTADIGKIENEFILTVVVTRIENE